MKDEQKKEFTLRITQANKSEMIVILYEMFLVYCSDAGEALDKEQQKEYRINIQRARGCLKELMGSLNYEAELAETYLRIYIYVSKLLVTADLHLKKEALEEAEKLVGKLKDGYEEVAKRDTSAPVMGNTQTVYAGLTYSRGQLSVNLDEGRGSRGFFA